MNLINHILSNLPILCVENIPTQRFIRLQNLFSMLAGKYSMSKINISIGIIALIIWGVLNMVHFGMFLKCQDEVQLNNLQCALFSIAELFAFSVILFAILNMLCKSRS